MNQSSMSEENVGKPKRAQHQCMGTTTASKVTLSRVAAEFLKDAGFICGLVWGPFS
jgi:hypothetical protein